MSLEALPFVRHIVYNVAHQICNGYYRKILFGREKGGRIISRVKKKQKNFKKAWLSIIKGVWSVPSKSKKHQRSITRYDIETKTLVIFTSKPPNSCHCPTDFKLWGSSNCWLLANNRAAFLECSNFYYMPMVISLFLKIAGLCKY